MIIKFTMTCIFPECKNNKDSQFYVMPIDVKTPSGDVVHDPSRFKIVCKKCGKIYKLKLNIKG